MPWAKSMVAACALCLLVVGAGAQGSRSSTWEPDVSQTFHQYFEPFAKVDTAADCRDICLRDPRCTGWTYYHPSFTGTVKNWESLLRTCVVGAGFKDRKANMPNRTSGAVR